MNLVLRITHFDSVSPPREMECEWDEMGGCIGRSTSNDWVLPDEKRFLSGRHAVIKCLDGDYYITDTSTNGVFINRNAVPLGRDNSARLKHGDSLKLGGYELEVILGRGQLSGSIPMSGNASVIESSSFEDPVVPKKPMPGRRPLNTDDPFSDFGLSGRAENVDATPDTSRNTSPLSDWSEAVSSEPDTFSSPSIPDDPFFTDGDFNMGSPSSEPAFPASQPADNKDDPFAGLSDYFAPQKFVEPSQPSRDRNAIKEESVDKQVATSVDLVSSSKPEISTDLWEQDETTANIPDQTTDIGQDVLPGDDATQFKSLVPGSTVELAGNIDTTHKTEGSPFSKQKIKSSPVSRAAPEILPASPSMEEQSVIQSDVSISKQNSQAIAAFLQGFGINTPEEQKVLADHLELEELGIWFRILLQGCMDVLRERASIKNEMRMDVTMFQSNQNNPVKFSIDAKDALNKLAMSQSKDYMPPEQSLAEAYDDIKAHQAAVMGGVQVTLKSVFQRFEPDKLVKRLQEHNPISARIPVRRKAKLWELFEILYTDIEKEAADDFQRLFGKEFADAYDAHITMFRAERNKG